MTQSLLKDPPHPGEVLYELYLKPLKLSFKVNYMLSQDVKTF